MEMTFTAEQFSELNGIIGELLGKPLPQAAMKDASTFLFALKTAASLGGAVSQPYPQSVQDDLAAAGAALRNRQRRKLGGIRAANAQSRRRSDRDVALALAARGIDPKLMPQAGR